MWQYGLWSFQTGNTKLDRFLHKNQQTQRKLLNFENRFNGEVSKIWHHFRSNLKIDIKQFVDILAMVPSQKESNWCVLVISLSIQF